MKTISAAAIVLALVSSTALAAPTAGATDHLKDRVTKLDKKAVKKKSVLSEDQIKGAKEFAETVEIIKFSPWAKLNYLLSFVSVDSKNMQMISEFSDGEKALKSYSVQLFERVKKERDSSDLRGRLHCPKWRIDSLHLECGRRRDRSADLSDSHPGAHTSCG